MSEAKKKRITAGKAEPSYSFDDIKQTKSGLNFKIKHQEKEFSIKSPMLGAFQAENITGCFAMAHELGVPTEKIIAAIASFKGMKRRLEKRLDGDLSKSGVTVFDDIAHSPEKAASVLRELRSIYTGKIIAVFEPNQGGRERASATKYDHAFKDADTVIIPRLTKLKSRLIKYQASMIKEGRWRVMNLPMSLEKPNQVAHMKKMTIILSTFYFHKQKKAIVSFSSVRMGLEE